MLVIKYAKIGDAKYVSHVDTLRVLCRTFRRMGLEVEYSKGFNPHMLLNMSPPLPVGMESVTEFVEVDTASDTKGIIERFNQSCPAGFKAISVWSTQKSPRITANTTAAEYIAEPIDSIVATNGGTSDTGNSVADTKIFIIPCGNKNLRADRHLESTGENPKRMKITRTKLFTGEDNGLVLMDDLMQN